MKKILVTVSGIAIACLLFAFGIPADASTGTGASGGNRKKFTTKDAEDALKLCVGPFGKARAQLLERMLRHETNHFRSSQYISTGSAGMEAGKWQDLPSIQDYIEFKDNHDGHIGKFIVWPSVLEFLRYLNAYINRHENNFARWNSTDINRQREYATRVNSVKNKTII